MHKLVGRIRRRGAHSDGTEPTGDHHRQLLVVAAIGVAIVVAVLHLTGVIGAGSH